MKVQKATTRETARFRTRRKNPRFQNEFKLNPSEWRVSRFAVANTIRPERRRMGAESDSLSGFVGAAEARRATGAG